MRETTIHQVGEFEVEVTKHGDSYWAKIKEGNRYYGVSLREGRYVGVSAGEIGGNPTIYDFPGSVMQDAMIAAIAERQEQDKA